MEEKKIFLLDFDGVLFDSTLEAYYVTLETTIPGSLNKNSIVNENRYNRFLDLRPFLVSAWQFYWIADYMKCPYDEDRFEHYSKDLINIQNDKTREFESNFLIQRLNLAKKNYYDLQINLPYKFWNLIYPIMRLFPERFKILSAKDYVSIGRTLDDHDFDHKWIDIIGKKEFKENNENKRDVFIKHIKKNENESFILFDDSDVHMKEFLDEPSVECFRVLWGYVPKDIKKNNMLEAFKKITHNL